MGLLSVFGSPVFQCRPRVVVAVPDMPVAESADSPGRLAGGGGRAEAGAGPVPPRPGPGPLTAHLRWWLRHITARQDSVRHRLRLLVWIMGSKLCMSINVVVMLLAVTDVVLSGSLFKGQVAARFGMGVYSCLWSQFIFLNRSHLLQASLGILADLADHTERIDAHPKSLERMRRTASRGAFLFRFYVLYSLTTEGVILVTFVALEPRWHTAAAGVLGRAWRLVGGQLLGEQEARLASGLRWTALVFQMSALFSCLAAFYTVISCIFVIYAATSDIYDVIGRSLEVRPCSRRWPMLQRALLQVSLLMDAAMVDTLPHLLVVVVILPLISTVEVVGNGMKADVFAMGTAPLILTVFVPLCLVGDALNASRSGVAGRAARGPWLEEDLGRRRLRLAVMHATLGRGARVRGRSIGVLDRRACGNALRSWFSFLQILMNVKTGGAVRKRSGDREQVPTNI